MSKHIGIVGCSAEGAALCYRTICAEAGGAMGEHAHPELSLHTFPLADYMRHIEADRWDDVAYLMARSATKLADVGAEFAICPDNTIHQAHAKAVEASPIPWLHIAEVVASEAAAAGHAKLGITGTSFLMTGPVYPHVLEAAGLRYEIPGEEDRGMINEAIFGRLVKGVYTDADRQAFNQVFARLAERGCDAVVMGCTEIPILMDGVDAALPTLDSTRLLARAAIRESLA